MDEDAPELLVAASKGDEKAVVELLEAGADIHAKDDQGLTPLQLAWAHGHEGVARLLTQRGANLCGVDPVAELGRSSRALQVCTRATRP